MEVIEDCHESGYTYLSQPVGRSEFTNREGKEGEGGRGKWEKADERVVVQYCLYLRRLGIAAAGAPPLKHGDE